MTLDEQLAMAVSSVAVPQNNAQVPPVTQPQPINPVQQNANAQVVQTTVTQGIPSPDQPQPVNQAPVNVSPINIEQASQEAEVNYNVKEIELGQKVSTRAIEAIKKLNPGDKFRFTLLTMNPGYAAVHNKEGLGKILCWSDPTKGYEGQCCKDCGEPKARYYWPVLVYGTMPGDPNTPLPAVKSEMRLLTLWDATTYDQMCSDIIAHNRDINSIDFIATVTDTYGRLDIRPATTCFRAMPEYAPLIQEMTANWENIKSRAPETIGRKLDDARYLKLTQQAVIPTMQTYDMNDIN